MSLPLYFDHNATTPCLPEVVEAMVPYFLESFGNASSHSHVFGWKAQEAVDEAREEVAALLGGNPGDIIFTSGATEAINLALQSFDAPGHILTLQTEHRAVLDTCRFLEQCGNSVTYLPVKPDGLPDLALLEHSIRPDTVLIAVMQANNETGVLLPTERISELARARNIAFFSDTVQSAGKTNVSSLKADFKVVSAHKIYGPKGVGALYVNREMKSGRLKALIHGGGQEEGLRSGTLNVPGIVGLGVAARLALKRAAGEQVRLAGLRDQLEAGLLAIDGCRINGAVEHRLGHVSNVSFAGVDGERLLKLVNRRVAVSSGSACAAVTSAPSHVLLAMGVTPAIALATLRFSLGLSTTASDIDAALSAVRDAVGKARN